MIIVIRVLLVRGEVRGEIVGGREVFIGRIGDKENTIFVGVWINNNRSIFGNVGIKFV